jgi:hypothetical protein
MSRFLQKSRVTAAHCYAEFFDGGIFNCKGCDQAEDARADITATKDLARWLCSMLYSLYKGRVAGIEK